MRKAKNLLCDWQKEDVKNLYLEGRRRSFICDYFEISESYCYSILREAGIERVYSRAMRSPYSLNESFFAGIESDPLAAYWAGFIAADGNIKKDSQTLRIGLGALDAGHLEQFLKHIGSNHPIRRTTRRYPSRTTECATVEIGSKSFAKDLGAIGIVPAKTFCFDWPDLPDEAARHFLRGYFDGDGSWILKPTRGPTPGLRFDLVGTAPFLEGCRAFLERTCGVGHVQLRQCSGSDSQTKGLNYSGNRQVPRIARFLYENAPVYLARKFEKARPFLTETP